MKLLSLLLLFVSASIQAGCLEHINQFLEQHAHKVYVHDQSSFLRFQAELDEYERGITFHPLDNPYRQIGRITYEIDGNEIYGIHIDVDLNFRQQGVAKTLFFRMIQRHPGVTRIRTRLSELNLDVFNEQIGRGATLEEALMETPAYKIRRDAGMGKVLWEEFKVLEHTIEFVVTDS